MSNGFDSLADTLTQAAQQGKKMQRQIHTELAAQMLSMVRSNIAGSLSNGGGRVPGWQAKYVGSGGGYAAVRPVDSSSGSNSPGAITNYLENGHAIRGRGRGVHYRPRIHVIYVDGRAFYASARAGLAGMLQTRVEAWAQSTSAYIGR